MTPEMSEEAKLKAKYGGALPRQLLTKKLMTKVKIGFLLFFKLTIFYFCFSQNISIQVIIMSRKLKVNWQQVNPIQQ